MLDTNALSDLIKNPQGAVAQRLAAVHADSICTSIVVACELRFGALRKASAVLTRKVDDLLCAITVLPLDGNVDQHYADIRLTLEKDGTPIGSNALLIAAHARSQSLVVVTSNLREFKRVPGLQSEDWLAPLD